MDIKLEKLKFIIKALCRRRGITQAELLTRAGLKQSNLNQKFNLNTVRYLEIEQLLNVLQCKLAIIDDNGNRIDF